MESPALVPSILQCGDGCRISSRTSTDEVDADQCRLPAACCSSSLESCCGLSAHCRTPSETKLATNEPSVYRAAELLYSLHLNDVESAQQCITSVAGVNCSEHHEENACNSICGCDMTGVKSVTSEGCNSTNCETTDATLLSDKTDLNTDAPVLESDRVSLTENDLKTDKSENGAESPLPASDSVPATTSIADRPSSLCDCSTSACNAAIIGRIEYCPYGCEQHLHDIMELVSRDLSEPYSIYTYRYFIYNWPSLCFRALDGGRCIGAIVCKLHVYQESLIRGYIAMLAVDKYYRRRGIGTQLVLCAIKAMLEDNCDDVVLEAEIENSAALRLYENLGFIRDKRLYKYYLNGHDAFRLHLLLN